MKSATSALATALAVILATTTCLAVEIPLVGLQGGYETSSSVAPGFGYPAQRSMDLVLPDGIVAIDAVNLVLSGEWTVGEMTCYIGGGIYRTYPLLPSLEFHVRSDAFAGDLFVAHVNAMPGGAFEGLALELTSSIGFDELIGAELHLELIIDDGVGGLCTLTGDPYGTLDDVHLEITGTVPSSASTWGSVKSLYR